MSAGSPVKKQDTNKFKSTVSSIFNQNAPANKNLENAALFTFNVYKIQNKKTYALDTWADL